MSPPGLFEPEHLCVIFEILCMPSTRSLCHLQLADFGLARRLSDLPADLTNRVITLWYRPPELLLGATRYGPSVDCWGVGCIFAELIIGKPLFPSKVELEQLEAIFKVRSESCPFVSCVRLQAACFHCIMWTGRRTLCVVPLSNCMRHSGP